MKPVREPNPASMTIDLTPEARANVLLRNEPKRLLKRVFTKRTQAAPGPAATSRGYLHFCQRNPADRCKRILQNGPNRIYEKVFLNKRTQEVVEKKARGQKL